MSQELEKPPTTDSLYLARGDDVSEVRPVLTGDVFEEVEVSEPDGTLSRRSVMVVDHPCSLRTDGVHLMPKLLVAAVEPREPLGTWRGNFSLMLLPGLELGTSAVRNAAAYFDDGYMISPKQLMAGQRVACLSTYGINLMLQRRVHRASRVVVPTYTFHEANEAVYEEADLIEEWCVQRCEKHQTLLAAAAECVEWLREIVDGTRRQEHLRDAQRRSAVRKAMRQHLANL